MYQNDRIIKMEIKWNKVYNREGDLMVTIVFFFFMSVRENLGMSFHDELSDMLLLKMLQVATRAAADKDKVRASTPAGYCVTMPIFYV